MYFNHSFIFDKLVRVFQFLKITCISEYHTIHVLTEEIQSIFQEILLMAPVSEEFGGSGTTLQGVAQTLENGFPIPITKKNHIVNCKSRYKVNVFSDFIGSFDATMSKILTGRSFELEIGCRSCCYGHV